MAAYVRRQAGELKVDAELTRLADYLHAVERRDRHRHHVARRLIECGQGELQRAFRMGRHGLLANKTDTANAEIADAALYHLHAILKAQYGLYVGRGAFGLASVGAVMHAAGVGGGSDG